MKFCADTTLSLVLLLAGNLLLSGCTRFQSSQGPNTQSLLSSTSSAEPSATPTPIVLPSTAPTFQTVSQLDSNNYLSWIQKSVCVDSNGNVLTLDPYAGCTTGNAKGLRKIAVGDPLPYNNIDQVGANVYDSYALLDSSGNPLYFHTNDYPPFNEFNLYSASDGFDVYSTTDGVLSIATTRDGASYGTTFFGQNCTVGGGWVFFPLNRITISGSGFWPIAANYWEHNGQSAPGECPSSFSTDTLNTWNYLSNFTFGGFNGNPTKVMDTIMSVHGYETQDGTTPTQNFLQTGHLEVFYFTREYGLTRWEYWSPAGQPPTWQNLDQCNGASTAAYQGQLFNVEICRDYSQIQAATTLQIPEFPLPQANLLRHSHFDGGYSDLETTIGQWHRLGVNVSSAQQTNWVFAVSNNGSDGLFGSGMSFLKINCGAAAGAASCTPLGTYAVYQDTPLTEVCAGCTYLYGVDVRTEVGTGTFQVALQIIDNNGNVTWEDDIQDQVSQDNGDGRAGEADSVYLSSVFIHKTITLPSTLNGTVLRFAIIPVTTQTFDIVDAWLNRFPKVNSQETAPAGI